MSKFKVGQVVKVVGESKGGMRTLIGREVNVVSIGNVPGHRELYFVETPEGLRTWYEESSLKKVKESRKELKAYISDLEERVESLLQETQDLYMDNAKKYDRIGELEEQVHSTFKLSENRREQLHLLRKQNEKMHYLLIANNFKGSI